MNGKEICKKAVDHFGFANQADLAQEECAELIVAINHCMRGRATVPEVCEEIADVEIMCMQLRVMYGDDIVDRSKKAKLERLEMLME